ncbi:hypothetical protein EDD18DRAFT_841708 [Armillaria luteobubalina]|uniref:F-box domain-containing protein n=1 Tax=Armillaria luteobubalina TaxID=153913 RepID=A0AA39P999_9AGAR|nr:hypothetical protein EDD18DRAFT_841708 [Armillaria luteobubalina]
MIKTVLYHLAHFSCQLESSPSMEKLTIMETETQNTSPPLHQEPNDYIIDILTFDIPTLRSCSLVCRSFLPRAHEHLFREVNNPRRPFYVSSLSSPEISRIVKSLIGVAPGEEGSILPYLILLSLP